MLLQKLVALESRVSLATSLSITSWGLPISFKMFYASLFSSKLQTLDSSDTGLVFLSVFISLHFLLNLLNTALTKNSSYDFVQFVFRVYCFNLMFHYYIPDGFLNIIDGLIINIANNCGAGISETRFQVSRPRLS